MNLGKEKDRALLGAASVPCDAMQCNATQRDATLAGAARAELLAGRQPLGRLPGDSPAVVGKGSCSKAAEPLPPSPPLPTGPCCTNLPLGGHPSSPVSFGERVQAALLQSPPPLPEAPAAQGPEPFPKHPVAALPGRDPARRGLSSPTALPEAAQMHLQSACSGSPQRWLVQESSRDTPSPLARTPSRRQQQHCRGSPQGAGGAFSEFPKTHGCCSAHSPCQLPRRIPRQPRIRLCLCYPLDEAPRRNKPPIHVLILRVAASSPA